MYFILSSRSNKIIRKIIIPNEKTFDKLYSIFRFLFIQVKNKFIYINIYLFKVINYLKKII